MTRADLPPAVQAVQAAHAALDFALTHPEISRDWHVSSNTLAVLAAADEIALHELLERAAGIPAVAFHEPDLGGALTAVALGPAGRKLCRKYPLALQGGDLQ